MAAPHPAPLTIAVDVMGADRGPDVLVRGALAAQREDRLRLLLVGDRRRIEPALEHGPSPHPKDAVEIVHTDEVATPGTGKMTAAQRRNASVAIAARLVHEGRADAMVSAGYTAATCAAAIVGIGRIRGIRRPPLAALFPTVQEPVLMLDVGATVDAGPEVLFQFGLLGSAYMREIVGRANPRVGLLSIGEEAGKGNAVVQRTFALFEGGELNFVGNAEGRDIVKGTFDVIVCDGFVGNSMLKFGENLCRVMLDMLGREFEATAYERFVARLLGRSFGRVRRRVDWAEKGGAPLLGLKGVCVVSDTSSCEKAIKNAIHTAVEAVRQHVPQVLERELASHAPARASNAGAAAGAPAASATASASAE